MVRLPIEVCTKRPPQESIEVVLDRSVIVEVGTLMLFADLDGNVFGAMQYDAAAE